MEFVEKATPESCGISSKNIIDFVKALCQCPENQETHSFLLIRHGKLVSEGYFAPYNIDTEHSLFSVSKSFTSIAIGFLVEEGKISVDDNISTYFPELLEEDINKENLKIKIHNLLTMSFGQQGGAVHESQKRAEMSNAMLYDFFYRYKELECGTKFRYDAYGTYMLSALVKKLTGMNVVEYLMPKFFEPLGIEKPYYVKDDIGINIGYSGMRMRARDLAKVGFTFLNNGVWDGKQIIPESWVKLATKKHISTDECSTGTDWQQGYCYQLWKGRYNTTRLCGAYGQMCVLMSDYDAVFVINSGYDNDKLGYILDSFYENIMLNMQDKALHEDKDSFEKLENILSNLKITYKFSDMSPITEIINGNTYEIPQKGTYKAIKFSFGENVVNVTLVSDEKNFEFKAGFNKPVFGKATGTHFASLEKEDNSDTVATAIWNTKKDLEITLRLIGTPSIIKVLADFSIEPKVEIIPIRSKL
ncbi:MAG: serine hydrolase [Clostridia bacterium]|nr:serine hydrolase [Clostridia bacterium]